MLVDGKLPDAAKVKVMTAATRDDVILGDRFVRCRQEACVSCKEEERRRDGTGRGTVAHNLLRTWQHKERAGIGGERRSGIPLISFD